MINLLSVKKDIKSNVIGSRSSSSHILRIDRGAVSEVIGSLLILVITVALFSGIIIFVHSMDVPPDNIYASFIGNIIVEDDGASIEIIHRGGYPLENYRTDIHLHVGEKYELCKIEEGLSSADKTHGVWNIGEVWKHSLNDTDKSVPVSVMIIDTKTNIIIWEADFY
ncbi:MAG: type IV pilin [Euryarchaeota archaeon]|nr:type IV pilin [Euryarchaeota archaeon]